MTRTLIGVAVLAVAPWLVVHGLGFRADVSALVMTGGDPVRGALYIVAWLAAVTVGPAAALAAAAHATLSPWTARSS